MIAVEVAYATADKQEIISVEIEDCGTIKQAIEKSGILQHFPEIDFQVNKVGLFSKIAGLDHNLKEGDRIEIYRALQQNPMEARRKRAARATRNQ